MKISLTKGAKVYVVTRSRAVTGGPEDMYELAHSIKKLYPGVEVCMYYLPEGVADAAPKAYEHFGIPRAEMLEDNEKNVVILPEIYTTAFPDATRIRKAIWWLSVDNYYFSPGVSPRMRWFNSMMFRRLRSQWFIGFNKKEMQKVRWHFVQARRIYDHLKKHGIENIFYLLDHVNPDFAHHTIDRSIKEDFVLYNSKKGQRFTKRLIKASPDITFVSVSPEGVWITDAEQRELMARAKVYIDFGNHPGGDRFPKETALYGCCVITGKRGTAGFFDDVQIPSYYKFSQHIFIDWLTVHRVRRQIKSCFKDYYNEQRKFRAFRERARTDYQQHLDDVQEIFSYEG